MMDLHSYITSNMTISMELDEKIAQYVRMRNELKSRRKSICENILDYLIPMLGAMEKLHVDQINISGLFKISKKNMSGRETKIPVDIILENKDDDAALNGIGVQSHWRVYVSYQVLVEGEYKTVRSLFSYTYSNSSTSRHKMYIPCDEDDNYKQTILPFINNWNEELKDKMIKAFVITMGNKLSIQTKRVSEALEQIRR